MGQTPSKFFPWPTPYGQSPDSNVLMKAQAAPQAPQQNFLPLNAPDPSATPPPATNQPQIPQGFNQQIGQYGGGGMYGGYRPMNRYNLQ